MNSVAEVIAALKARPVQWLLDNMPVDHHWCMIHSTHLDDAEIAGFAKAGGVAGLCPITEANLGDGIFRAPEFLAQGGVFGIGSDSNIRIGLAEELRMLEVSQRLRDRRRLVLTNDNTYSNGRFLYEQAAKGGAQAIGRTSGKLEVGALADLVSLDDEHHSLAGLTGDSVLDAFIFGASEGAVSDVWAAGRHVVANGAHKKHAEITAAFSKTVKRLRGAI